MIKMSEPACVYPTASSMLGDPFPSDCTGPLYVHTNTQCEGGRKRRSRRVTIYYQLNLQHIDCSKIFVQYFNHDECFLQ